MGSLITGLNTIARALQLIGTERQRFEKAMRVVESCETCAHVMVAHRYVEVYGRDSGKELYDHVMDTWFDKFNEVCR